VAGLFERRRKSLAQRIFLFLSAPPRTRRGRLLFVCATNLEASPTVTAAHLSIYFVFDHTGVVACPLYNAPFLSDEHRQHASPHVSAGLRPAHSLANAAAILGPARLHDPLTAEHIGSSACNLHAARPVSSRHF